MWVAFGACHGAGPRQASSGENDSLFHSALLKKVTDSISRYPDSARLYFERGGILYVMKEYTLAGKDLKKAISLDPLKADYYISLGEIALGAQDLPEAEQSYRKALTIEPGNLMARLQLTYVLLGRQDYHAALGQADSLLARDDQVVQAYGLKAQALEALGDSASALKWLQKAVSLAPADYDALMATGDLLWAKEDTAALGYYRRAAAADTAEGEPLYCIGLVQASRGSFKEAVAAYKACIARDAYYLKAYLGMGDVLERQNDWEDALKVYILATRIDPTSSEAFYRRGFCEEQLHRIPEARSDYQDALDLESGNREARQALDQLNGTDSLTH